ncbi:urease accessory protein UreD [Tateyamaria pelophila]|uniref:urease accessory protein UreD n=1 Tax=Tateyamaria pelophila TaxID=328415 RepID=UPI001CBBE70A|nr:urease accessory protein UreD [Tateyamaria pelophila]
MAKDMPDPEMTLPRNTVDASASWVAKLDLDFIRKHEKTLVHKKHVGPMLVQRPFYPESDGTCHSYILHPPGGVAGGDSLGLRINVGAGASSVLTSPGATKFYRSPHRVSTQRIEITVDAGGACEFLPMENIVFNDARARTETEVTLKGDATFVGWDITSLGRPAAQEAFDMGSFEQRTTITRDGRPIWFERAAFDGDADFLRAAYGLSGQPIFGTMIYAGPLPEDAVETIRQHLEPAEFGQVSISQLQDVVVCRYAGSKVRSARQFFLRSWDLLRRLGLGKAACHPRIWST